MFFVFVSNISLIKHLQQTINIKFVQQKLFWFYILKKIITIQDFIMVLFFIYLFNLFIVIFSRWKKDEKKKKNKKFNWSELLKNEFNLIHFRKKHPIKSQIQNYWKRWKRKRKRRMWKCIKSLSLFYCFFYLYIFLLFLFS